MSGGVAVIGLGQMGRGIARNLDAAGVLTAACDARLGQVAAAELTVPAMQGQALVDRARVILCVVPSTGEVAAALKGCTARDGQIVVDLTTSDPAQSRALARDLAARGFGYLDAAMTGGAAGADAGTLTLMAGGPPEMLETCRPALEVFARRIFHLGPVGSGHAMKLVHNMILHSSFMATCEGLRLASRAGLDPAQAVAVLNAGNARSYVTEVRFPRDILSGTMNARSVIANLEKDLGLACEFAGAAGAPAPYAQMTHALLARAVAEGKAQTDFSHLFEMFEGLAEVTDGG